MAFATKYRCEFTDINGIDWKIDIQEDSYAGAVNTMEASDNPLEIEFLTLSDELLFTPIKGSTAKLDVICSTNFQYIDLYSEENMQFKMIVYKNGIMYWQGWVTSDYTEPYDPVPYVVSIHAADGLGLLKNIAFKDGEDYYTGREYEHTILLNILSLIGYDQFTEFVNLYEDLMADADDDSPMEQILIDQDVFKGLVCYNVVEEILKKYNAVIRQTAGQFVIFRPAELVGDTVYGRIITAASVTGTSMTPDQYVNRDDQASGLEDFEGGVMMMKPAISKFTSQQDYGNRQSWIRNHNFPNEAWETIANCTSWDGGGGVSLHAVQPAEMDGIVIFPDGSGNIPEQWQTFGTYIKTTTDVCKFSFQWKAFKPSAGDASLVDFKIKIESLDDNYWLNDDSDTEASWSATEAFINVAVGTVTGETIGEWTGAEYTITDGIPADGEYMITLYAADTANVFLSFKDIRFYTTSDEFVAKHIKTKAVPKWYKIAMWIPGVNVAAYFLSPWNRTQVIPDKYTDVEEIISRTYEATNAINGVEASQSYSLGDAEDTNMDNVLEQFMGSLAIYSTGSLKQTARDFVNDFAADYMAANTIVTASGNVLTFTSSDEDFTGATSITPVGASSLDGTVVNVQAYSAGTSQVDRIDLDAGSTGGTAQIKCGGLKRTATWDTDLSTTAAAFVTDFAADYLAMGITLTNPSGGQLRFTATTAGQPFVGDTTITNLTGDLDGTASNVTPNGVPTARIDTITLEGSDGTATVVCDAVTKTLTYNTDTVLDYTTSWHTKGGSEAQPVIELISDETADLYSKGRQFVQMNLREVTDDFSMIGNLQDTLNTSSGDNRVFVANRGTLNCQMREWTLDLIEIGEK